jgi:hypothetical protein
VAGGDSGGAKIMEFIIIPNVLRDAINAKIDAALKDLPAEANVDREVFYQQILAYYNDTGQIPDFKIEKRNSSDAANA